MPTQDDLTAVIAVAGDQLPQAPSMALRPKSSLHGHKTASGARAAPGRAGGGIRSNDCSGLGNRAARRSSGWSRFTPSSDGRRHGGLVPKPRLITE